MQAAISSRASAWICWISSTAAARLATPTASAGWTLTPGRPEVWENIWRKVIAPLLPVKAGRLAETGVSRSSRPSSTSVITVAADSILVAEAIGTTVAGV